VVITECTGHDSRKQSNFTDVVRSCVILPIYALAVECVLDSSCVPPLRRLLSAYATSIRTSAAHQHRHVCASRYNALQ